MRLRSPAEHYAAAEEYLYGSIHTAFGSPENMAALAVAQVHATLARVDRETFDGARIDEAWMTRHATDPATTCMCGHAVKTHTTFGDGNAKWVGCFHCSCFRQQSPAEEGS